MTNKQTLFDTHTHTISMHLNGVSCRDSNSVFKGLEKILVPFVYLCSFDVGVSSMWEMCSIRRQEHHAACLTQASTITTPSFFICSVLSARALENQYISEWGSEGCLCWEKWQICTLLLCVRRGCRAFWCGGVILGSPYPNSTCRAAWVSVKGSLTTNNTPTPRGHALKKKRGGLRSSKAEFQISPPFTTFRCHF